MGYYYCVLVGGRHSLPLQKDAAAFCIPLPVDATDYAMIVPRRERKHALV